MRRVVKALATVRSVDLETNYATLEATINVRRVIGSVERGLIRLVSGRTVSEDKIVRLKWLGTNDKGI